MKKIILLLAMITLLAVSPPAAFTSPILLNFSSEYYSFSNPDMAAYDQATYNENQAHQTRNTDDDISFALTTLRLSYNKKYLNNELFIKMRFEGFWGNDNMGENSKNSAIFYDNLYTNLFFAKNSYIGIGRMNYSIGGAITDYFFDDIIDGVIVKYESTAYGFPFDMSVMTDVMGMASRPEETNRFSHIQKDDEEIDDFQGDTTSSRYGADASFWFIRGFVYYVRYAASKEGGTDIAQNGDTPANSVDGDYLTFGGGRLFYDFKRWGKADFTYAYSTGYDFQYAANHSYNGNGIAFNYMGDIMAAGGLSENIVKNVFTSFSFGMFSEGFCGMKGASFGENILDDYSGYSVAPYAGAYHFYDYSKKDDARTFTDRSVSKTFYKAVITTVLRMGIEIDLGYMMLTANENGENGIMMGNEYITGLRYAINNVVFAGSFNYFKPGDYYKTRSESNPYIPAGKDPFYSIMFSFTSNFTIIE